MRLKRVFAGIVSGAIALSALNISVFAEDVRVFEDKEGGGSFYFTASSGWAGGAWLVGSDNKDYENPLTIADLEAADYIEISYKIDDEIPLAPEGIDESAKLTFIYKFVTNKNAEDVADKWEAYLQDGWIPYGPAPGGDFGEGNTYQAFDYFSFDVKKSDTLKIKTSDILDSLKVDKSEILYMNQFGLGCNVFTYDADLYEADYELEITGVKLVKEGSSDDTKDDTTADDAKDDTTADAGKDEKPNTDTGVEGVAVIAGLAVVAAGAIIVFKKRK